MQLFFIIIVSVGLQASCCYCNENLVHQENTSVLIIGSSIPALASALFLTDNNVSVTLVYSTKEIDNQISSVTTSVDDINYILPKQHPSIYEHSKLTRNLAERFENKFLVEEELNLLTNVNKMLSITSNESIFGLLISAFMHDCIGVESVMHHGEIVHALKNYEYIEYRKLYSNMTLAQFAKLKNAPQKFISCFLSSSLIDLGEEIDNINAADAIARIQFYYLFGNNGLRSYHMYNSYNSQNTSHILMDQIIHQLRLKNTKFISNYSVEALWIDPINGKILGDINNQKIKYDYVIVGDSLNRSTKLLSTTEAYNTGAAKISLPLRKFLSSINQYSPAPNIFSIKMWLTTGLNSDRKSLIQVNNSPYPFSIQSIRQINKLSGNLDKHDILEVIVANKNHSTTVDMTKIFKELLEIFPELKSLDAIRVDHIDNGVTMDIKYGTNRLAASSLVKLGISNLILAGDWLDTNDGYFACDLEKSIYIGYQVAYLVLGKENNQNEL